MSNMKKFKRIYLEITNVCNFNCTFCPKTTRKTEFLSLENFNILIDKIKSYTDYVYLHVMGEPLLNDNLEKFFEILNVKNLKVNLTTNGFLLPNKIEILKNAKSLRKLTISIHSFNSNTLDLTLKEYLVNCISCAKILKETLKDLIVEFRMWNISSNMSKKELDFTTDVLKFLQTEFNNQKLIDINSVLLSHKIINNFELAPRIFLTFADRFIWPNVQEKNYGENGFCHALRDQIAILVDGTVVPCCLDNNGVMNLGNIYQEDLQTIFNSDRYKNIYNCFSNRKKFEELCKHCQFSQRFKK